MAAYVDNIYTQYNDDDSSQELVVDVESEDSGYDQENELNLPTFVTSINARASSGSTDNGSPGKRNDHDQLHFPSLGTSINAITPSSAKDIGNIDKRNDHHQLHFPSLETPINRTACSGEMVFDNISAMNYYNHELNFPRFLTTNIATGSSGANVDDNLYTKNDYTQPKCATSSNPSMSSVTKRSLSRTDDKKTKWIRRSSSSNSNAGSSGTMPVYNPSYLGPCSFQEPEGCNVIANNFLYNMPTSASYASYSSTGGIDPIPVSSPSAFRRYTPYLIDVPNMKNLYGLNVMAVNDALQKNQFLTNNYPGEPGTVGYTPNQNMKTPRTPDYDVPEQNRTYSVYTTAEGQSYPLVLSPENMIAPDLPQFANCKIVLDHGEIVTALTLSNPTRLIYTAGRSVKIWDISESGAEQPITQLDSSERYGYYIRSIKVLPDHRTLVVAGEDTNISIWDLASPSPRKTAVLPLTGENCYGFAISSDSRIGYSCHTNGKIAAWDLHNNKLIAHFQGHKHAVTCIDLSSDGNTLWTGSGDCTVRNWDLREGIQMQKLDFPSSILSLECCPTGGWLVVGSSNGNIDVLHTKRLDKLQLFYHEDSVLSVKFARGGKWFLSTGKDKLWHAWGTYNGSCLFRKREMFSCLCCDISADDKYIVTGSGDQKVRVYDIIY